MITLLACFTVKSGEEARFEQATRALFEAVRSEPGCASLVCLRDNARRQYVFVERYYDADALAAHRKSAHLKRLGPTLLRAIDGEVEVEEFEELEW